MIIKAAATNGTRIVELSGLRIDIEFEIDDDVADSQFTLEDQKLSHLKGEHLSDRPTYFV